MQKQVFLAETRVNDLSGFLQSLIRKETSPEVAFRITILSSVYSLSTAEYFFSEESLQIDLYNYLWASYFTIPANSLNKFGSIMSRLLCSILGMPLPQIQTSIIPLLPMQYSNKKPLFGRLDIEAGLTHLIPFLYAFPQPMTINEAIHFIVKHNFNKLKASVQLCLIVVAEQISLELPVHNLILTCEKLKLCKILRVIAKLANVEVLFSQYDPIFGQDSLISLLALPNHKEISLRTTRISRKTSHPCLKDTSRLFGTIDSFTSMFFSIFKSANNFSKNFNQSLTRFLIVCGYSLHISKDSALHRLLLGLLEKFDGFYDMQQVNLAATAMRSCILLEVIYEFSKDWGHVVRAKLMQGEEDPVRILEVYMAKVQQEHEIAQIIHSCLIYWLRIGYTREQFLGRCSSNPHRLLIEYIVNNS